MAKIFTYKSHVVSFFFSFVLCIISVNKTSAQPMLGLTQVLGSGLNAPIQLVNAGDGSNRIFIVQQGGGIKVFDAGFNFIADFLTVSNVQYSGERGLLSMVFHPQYQSNGLFYVYYVNTAGSLELSRYKVSAANANVADPASKVILITIPHPTNTNHNGGELHFGNDGFLYLSTGDGGGGGDQPNNAQNTAKLLGKILRFNVNTSNTAPYYTIPAGNPYGNEVFHLGLRNPFRWSFDSQTYDMWIGDVGQDSYEEINYLPASQTGVNFGWHCYEANNPYNTTGCGTASSYVFPVYFYPTADPSAAVTGGVVYRGNTYPDMQGYYFSVDFFSGVFNKTISDGAGNWSTFTQALSPSGIVDFGETENHEVYVVSLTGNSVYHLVSSTSGPAPVTLLNFSGNQTNDGVKLSWQTSLEQNLRQFEIEYSRAGASFTNLGVVLAQNASSGYSYSFTDPVNYDGVIFYRLKILSDDGSYKYSNVVRLSLDGHAKNMIFPSVIADGIIRLNITNTDYQYLELVNIEDGRMILKVNIDGRTGDIQIPIGKLNKGMYAARLTGSGAPKTQKIFIQ